MTESNSFDQVITMPRFSNSKIVTSYFELMKEDTVLAIFLIEESSIGKPKLTLLDSKNSLYDHPYMKKDFTEGKFMAWLESRFIPRNRRFREEILKTIGTQELVGKLRLTLGLTLIDSYWIRPLERQDLRWSDINLFDNDLDTAIASIAFTGFGDYRVEGMRSSPEFTTDGMLRKVWRRGNDGIAYLYKAGTEGYSNAGLEPYSEYYVAQLANYLGFEHVPYELVMYSGHLCSVCPNMVNKGQSFVPASGVFGNEDPDIIFKEVYKMGSKSAEKLINMTVLDYLTMNSDRHLGNYGFMYDAEMKFIDTAPIYDNGLGLSPYYVPKKYTIDELEEYLVDRPIGMFWIKSTDYEVFKDFFTRSAREKLRKALGFKFQKHSSYNLGDRRLKLLENVIKHRVSKILS